MRKALVLLMLVLASCGRETAVEVQTAAPPPVPIARPVSLARGDWQVGQWYAAARAADVKRFLDADHAVKLAAAARKRAPAVKTHRLLAPVVQQATSPYPCGGDLPPCYVLRRESLMAGNPPKVYNGMCYYEPGYLGDNPCGSTASGLWQFLRSTWGTHQENGVWVPGYGGYFNAADAPISVQNDFARILWNHGRGCSHWAACG